MTYTHLYVLVTETGIERLELEERLKHQEIKDKVGVAGENCNIDFITDQFSDENIDIICDDEFLAKELPVTCIAKLWQMQLRGQILIAGCREGETIGLTEEQFEIVKKGLTLVKDKGSVLQIYRQTNIPTHIPTNSPNNTTAENN